MDLSDIANRIRQAAEEKARQEAAAKEASEHDKRELNRLHVLRMQETFNDVVEPLLKEGAMQIKKEGYVSATVEHRFSKDPLEGMRNIIIEVRLDTQGKNVAANNRLGVYAIRYNADVNTFVVNCSFEINGHVRVIDDGRNMTLPELTADRIEAQFRRFFDEMMKADLGA